jgi:hypothetical protein
MRVRIPSIISHVRKEIQHSPHSKKPNPKSLSKVVAVVHYQPHQALHTCAAVHLLLQVVVEDLLLLDA